MEEVGCIDEVGHIFCWQLREERIDVQMERIVSCASGRVVPWT